jgi:hypothetical protein
MTQHYTTPYEQTQQQDPWANAAQFGMGVYGLLNPQAAASPQYQQLYGQFGAGQQQAAQRAQYQDVAADIARMYGYQGQQQALAGQVGNLATNVGRQSLQYYNQPAARGRYGGAMDPISQGYGALPGRYAGQAAGINRGYGQRAADVMGGFGRGAAGVGQGYQQRLATGMGMLSGYGRQAGADISRRYGAAGSTAQANLAARGLGGTTVAGDVGRGFATEESAEQRRLGEDVQRMQTGLYAGLSGDALRSRENLLQYGTGMRAGLTGEALSAQQQAAQFGAGLSLDALGAQGDIARGGVDYQDQAMQTYLANRFGYGMAPIQAGWDAAQSGINLTQGINRLPPQGYQSMGYGY